MSNLTTFAPGDWVVHRHHGIGMLRSARETAIGDEANTYYKIKTFNSTVWLPVDKANDKWLRPLATPAEMEQALQVLGSPPRPMSKNRNKRLATITAVDSNDPPVAIAELLRDLCELKREKRGNLSKPERDALRRFTDCFLAEWSVCCGISVEVAAQEFERLIRLGQEHLRQAEPDFQD